MATESDWRAKFRDTDAVFPVLASWLRERRGDRIEISKIDLETLIDRMDRVVIRYLVEARDRSSGAVTNHRVIGKAFRSGPREKIFDFMRNLWQNGFGRDSSDGIHIPEPLSYTTPLRLLLQEDVPGDSSDPLGAGGRFPTGFVKTCARVAAKLHRVPAVAGEPSSNDYVSSLSLDRLASACPVVTPQIDHLLTAANRWVRELGELRPCAVHGSFTSGQFILRDQRCWLIDFDKHHYGDGAWDLARFFVHSEVTLHLPQRTRERLIRTFFEEYRSTLGGLQTRGLENRVRVYQALHFAKKADTRFRKGKCGEEYVQEMFARALQVLPA